MHVLPDLPLGTGIAQKVRRVISTEHLPAIERVETPSQSTNRFARVKQGLCRHCSQATDKLRIDHLQLASQEAGTMTRFLRQRISVSWRTTLERVEDIDIVTTHPTPLDDLGKQLAGPANERNPLDILIRPRGLSHETKPGVRVPHAENCLATVLDEFWT